MDDQETFIKALAVTLDSTLQTFYEREMGFALLIFEFNSDQANYISNAKREDMVKALRETANRIERKQL